MDIKNGLTKTYLANSKKAFDIIGDDFIIVIKDIKPDNSKDMTASKLLGLVNSRAVVCQPWEDSNKLAKKTVFSWKNNTLRVVKTMFQLVPSSSPSLACPVLAQEPLESSPKACLSLLADPKTVWVPWSNQTYAQICAANGFN